MNGLREYMEKRSIKKDALAGIIKKVAGNVILEAGKEAAGKALKDLVK